MNVLCAICQDLLVPCNDIFITPCGHVFHFPCLIPWLEKSESCPQCRQKVKRDKLTRIYFNFSNTEAIKEDSVTLQQKVDSLSFQYKLKETEYNNCRNEIVTLKRQNSGLREEIKKTENEITQKNSVIYTLKQQISYLKDETQRYNGILEEKKKLENKLETFQNVKMLVCSTSDEVEEMLKKATDITTLCTYVAVMKRELSTSFNKRKELRNKMRKLEQDVHLLKTEKLSISEHFEQLQTEYERCKNDKKMLENQLKKLQSGEKCSSKSTETTKTIEKDSKSVTLHKPESDIDFDFNVPSPKKPKQAPERQRLNFSPKSKDDSDLVIVSPAAKKIRENEENSPYLPTKTNSILGLKDRPAYGAFSIKRSFHKSKSELSLKNSKDSSITFDGFGGHSKIETFPSSKTSKLKRTASDLQKNKKAKMDLSSNKQLDDFVINLT